MQTIPVTRCSEREMDNDGTGNRETWLEALDKATAGMIRLAVANARPGAGTLRVHTAAQGRLRLYVGRAVQDSLLTVILQGKPETLIYTDMPEDTDDYCWQQTNTTGKAGGVFLAKGADIG